MGDTPGEGIGVLTDLAEKTLAAYVAASVHSQKFLDAARAVNEFFSIGLRLDEDSPAKYLPPLQNYIHSLLDFGGAAEAAKILWTPTQFTPEPQSCKDLWNLFDTSQMGLIMGGASMSKSYSTGVRLFLEWIRDPNWTSIKVLGPSQSHLSQNLFSHLVALHRSATLPMPGTIGELYIGMDRRDQLSSILGVVIPIGQTKKAGRLQGVKRKPRPEAHPIFGPLSRLFIFVDEIENVPSGLWSDIDNVLSQSDETVGGFKIFGAFNPSRMHDETGKRAEPPFGWENLDADTHFRWKSVRGWDVLRLDGERSENVLQNKIVYPGLQTKAGLEIIARNAGGRNSAGYFSMGRGLYPPSGIELTVVPQGMLNKWRGEFLWYDDPIAVGACDVALEGRAGAVFSLGKWGKATGIKYPPNIDHPNGHKVMFKDRSGNSIIRWGLQVTQQFSVPKGDTVKLKGELLELCRKAAVRPEYFAIDRTGNGAGTADLLRYEWSSLIQDVNFSEAASKDKLMIEDSKTCVEQFDRMNSELWFALRSWGEFQYLLFSPGLDMTRLSQQLTQRRFRTAGPKSKVESKKDYVGRGYDSPDEADSLCLLVHAARKGSAVVLSMKIDESANLIESGDDVWGDYIPNGGVRIDASNRTDWLDDRMTEHPLL